jgi:hypothetical protein
VHPGVGEKCPGRVAWAAVSKAEIRSRVATGVPGIKEEDHSLLSIL